MADWIEWGGSSKSPVAPNTAVEIRLRCGEENEGPARGFDWPHGLGPFGYEGDDDIIAYRVVSTTEGATQ